MCFSTKEREEQILHRLSIIEFRNSRVPVNFPKCCKSGTYTVIIFKITFLDKCKYIFLQILKARCSGQYGKYKINEQCWVLHKELSNFEEAKGIVWI
jgi:hypothetical protein